MKAGPPGYLWSKYEYFLIDRLSKCELLENLKIKFCRSVMGTRAQTTGVTAIALLVLRTGELKRGITLQRKVRRKRKKYWSFLFFILIPHIKFQDIKAQQTDGQTHALTQRPKPICPLNICPLNFFEVGGIIKQFFAKTNQITWVPKWL